MKWIKYRTIWADGPEGWNYSFVHDSWDETDVEEDLNDCVSEYRHMDHFRKVEWEFIDKPPVEVVRNMIDAEYSKIKSAEKVLQYLCELLHTY